MKNNRKRNISW